MKIFSKSLFAAALLALAAMPPAGAQTWPAKPLQVAEYVKAEIAKWGKVVRDTGAKPD